MSIRRDQNWTIVLDGSCPVEDAEPLLQMLQDTPHGPRRLDAMPPPPYGRSASGSRDPACPSGGLRRYLGRALDSADLP